ncbi:hypothetical protein [Castellaniella sp. S9]|uniref:hypothetical protein n=1 Tax=Castellaniella sp. S9 TaxID=2993652 RepID=UPI0022B5A898|nr:hypothetical protein [Castellaniella sp. S9]
MPSIFTKDSLRASVEAATGGRITVLYTATGQPSYMNVIPKFNLEDIDVSLGVGVHPAFIVGGATKSEIFIGTYQGIDKNGEFLSLPGVDPTASRNFDSFVSLARANGPGWHCITNAEFAALALWCWKNSFMPNGNNNYGRDTAAKWETGRRQDGGTPGEAIGTARTLTGSGPASWRHDNTPTGIADLNGNIWEWSPGMRLMDGEIQVIPDNDAALPDTDFSAGSSAWRAILASDGSLVAPGTAGTLKYDSTNVWSEGNSMMGAPILSDVIDNITGTPGNNATNEGWNEAALEALTHKDGLVVPGIAMALGLYPAASSGLGSDRLYTRNYGERLPSRGGTWGSGGNAGVFTLTLNTPRSYAGTTLGSRPAFVL